MTAYRPMLSGTEVSNSASRTEAYSLDEALQAAAEEAARSVILSDTGDNPRLSRRYWRGKGSQADD
ncbi:hypothetical protein [Brevibacillus formosus]|uniref:hypothetical protein n=1 Tax=Brevibacillus formosus TaxID=54913 RepID=UPI003F1BB2AA